MFLAPNLREIVVFVFIESVGYEQIDKNNINTVEPVCNGHPRYLRNWPLNTGSLKILTGRGLMSILMAHHTKHFMHGNNRTINTLSGGQYYKQSSVPTCNCIIYVTLRPVQ